MALASALAKISRGAEAIPNPVAERMPAAAQLYIVPTHISEMFSTHPATERRIEALQDMALEMQTPVAAVRPRRSALDPLG
jgi:heat shock protein HtpX